MVYIRRTDEKGSVFMLGRTFSVDENWRHRLVRCQVDLDAELIKFYELRRREPNNQPCLGEVPYKLAHKRFSE